MDNIFDIYYYITVFNRLVSVFHIDEKRNTKKLFIKDVNFSYSGHTFIFDIIFGDENDFSLSFSDLNSKRNNYHN